MPEKPDKKPTGERHFKSLLLEQASIDVGADVLDVGCGSGTLALEVARRFPSSRVTGLDADAKMLRRAREKAAAGTAIIRFDQGFSDTLPYADATFDRVFSSLLFHHFDTAAEDS